MPLANISNAPSDAQQQTFNFAHFQDHAAVVSALFAATGINLSLYAIFPTFSFGPAWKQLHQAMHDETNQLLGTQGQNLRGEIDDDWYADNYLEHQAWHALLGI